MPKSKKNNFHDMETRVLNERLASLKAELNDTQDKMHKVKINGRQKDRMIMELEQELETMKIDARGQNRQIKQLKKTQNKVTTLEKTNKSLQEMIQSLRTENNYLESAFDRLELQSKKFKKDAEARYIEMNKEKEDLKDKVFQEKVVYDCQIIEMKDNTIHKEKECESLNSQLHQIKNVYQKLVKNSINCREELESLKSSYKQQLKLNGVLDHELKKIREVFETEKQDLLQQSQSYKRQLNDQLQSNQSIQEKYSHSIEVHSEDMNTKNDIIQKLQTHLAEQNIKYDSLRSELKHIKLMVEIHKRDAKKYNQLLQDKDVLIKTYMEEKDDLVSKLKHHKEISLAQETKIEASDIHSQNLQSNLGHANHTIEEKDKTIHNLQTQLESYRQDLRLMEKQKQDKISKIKEFELKLANQTELIALLHEEKRECRELLSSLDSLNNVIQTKETDLELCRDQVASAKAQNNRLQERNSKYDEYIKTLKQNYSDSIQKMQKIVDELKLRLKTVDIAQTSTTQYQLKLKAATEKHTMDINKIHSIVKSITKLLELNTSFDLLGSIVDVSTIEHELLRIKQKSGDNIAELQTHKQKMRMQEIEMMNEKEKLERQQRMQKIQFDIDLAMKQCEYKTLKKTLQKEHDNFHTEFEVTDTENKKIQSALEWDVLELQEKAKRLERELNRKIKQSSPSEYDQNKVTAFTHYKPWY